MKLICKHYKDGDVHKLTIGKTYEVLREYAYSYVVRDDNGNLFDYYKEHVIFYRYKLSEYFTPITEHREKLLKQILNESSGTL